MFCFTDNIKSTNLIKILRQHFRYRKSAQFIKMDIV